MIDYQQFCQIKTGVQQGMSVNQIALETGLHARTVRKWLSKERFEESAGGERPRASKLDAHRETIRRLLALHDYTARQVQQRLIDQGYEGGYSILKEYVRRVRPRPQRPSLLLKFEPGECAQVDWGSWGSIRAGNTRRALSFFVMVLCHSRWLHVEFTLGQGQEWFLGCHERAFRKLGAVPRAVIVDNCKTAVLSHRRGEGPVYNPQYQDYARGRGFEIRACAPRHPQSKGIVENAVSYVKGNFLSGLELGDFSALGPACSAWLDAVANVRLHSETRERPVDLLEKERSRLLPLTDLPGGTATTRTVRACRRCRVQVDANRYSVPPLMAGKMLTLQLEDERLRLFDEGRLVAEHRRSFERGRDIVDPRHEKELLDARSRAWRARLLGRFLEICPEAPRYREGLEERRLDARSHMERIVALCEVHGKEVVGRALRDALDLGAYSCEYIANLLAQRSRVLPQAGALHLTRASDMLDLELPEPDLSVYGAGHEERRLP
jgi:transposase